MLHVSHVHAGVDENRTTWAQNQEAATADAAGEGPSRKRPAPVDEDEDISPEVAKRLAALKGGLD